MKAYRGANPEKTRDISRRSYVKHRERRIAEVSAYYLANVDRKRRYNSKYHRENRDRLAEYDAIWRANNRERTRVNRHNYDARKRANGGRLTVEEWRSVLAEFGYRCAYCSSSENLEMDHVVPVVKGGRHDLSNVVPACMSCNRTKSDRSALWFLRYRKESVGA